MANKQRQYARVTHPSESDTPMHVCTEAEALK